MADDDPEDLDLLKRSELAELDGPAYTVACVLDDWNHRLNGLTSSSHGAGLFLDLLAAEGWRVTPIEPVPSLDQLLAPGERPPVVVEFPDSWTRETIARIKAAWEKDGGEPIRFRQSGRDYDA